jgi:alkanesulfonate monooxygenase SsuD/methylene tetrahydromethanopterin reductase-like flavin-dependent oxidoreductase (luciferase family)
MTFAFGIFDSFDLGDSTPGRVLADRLDLAVTAEAAGFGHFHVTEHHGTPLSVCPSPNLFLAAVSQRTSTLRIGALVHVLPEYEPLRLAEEIATLDQLCQGRLDVGIGSGVSPYELAFFGVDATEARARYVETRDLLLRALETGRMTHRGELLRDYDVELSVRPVQRPHPPLWYASSNTNSAEWAGANGVNFVGRWNGGTVVPAVESYWQARESSSVAGDAVPRVGVAATVHIGSTDGEAMARYRRANDIFCHELAKLWHDNDDHRVDGFADTEAALKHGNALVGSAETVRDMLVAQVEQVPVNYFEAMFSFGDLTAAEVTGTVHAFAEVVMPAVREAAGAR